MNHTLAALPLYSQRAAFTADQRNPLLIEAEPGAGKSTLIPLWALESCPPERQVWLIQPRILATRTLARRLASLVATPESVGYQVPYERHSSAQTRLLVMTPGIFIQRLLHDPELSQVHTVIMDEVHERALNQDVAWVWLQELLALRDDLRVLMMTATPDPALRRQLPHRLHAEGRQFPVQTHWLPAQPRERLAEQVMRALHHMTPDPTATVLVFLPGWADIETCQRLLLQRSPQRTVVRLHSRVSATEQQQAIDPTTGPRIILSTNIAETALTVPDVTWVIDSGLARTALFDQNTGTTRLVTRRISQAAADQRRGRAGRIQAGQCVRLWAENQLLAPAERAEITQSDAVPLALLLAHWGTAVQHLNWPDSPSPLALQAARQRLTRWGHTTDEGRITPAGRQVAALGTHPRIAAWLQQYPDRIPQEALTLALALHFTPDIADDADTWRSEAASNARHHPHWQQLAQRWLKVLSVTVDPTTPWTPESLAAVMPERIGVRQPSGLYCLHSGTRVDAAQSLTAATDWALFLSLNHRGDQLQGYAVPLQLNAVQQRALSIPQTRLTHARQGWTQVTDWCLGGQVIDTEQRILAAADVPQALLSLIAAVPLAPEQWPHTASGLLARARLADRHQLLTLPALDNSTLHSQMAHWLLPFLTADTALDALPWQEALVYYLGHDAVRTLDQWLPEHITLPSGRTVAVDYHNDTPTVTGKLQEFFGASALALADGRIPLTVHLLSPAGRPLAITADLASFWQNSYSEVRKEMRGRYPRHPWPEDPAHETATAKTKKALARGL